MRGVSSHAGPSTPDRLTSAWGAALRSVVPLRWQRHAGIATARVLLGVDAGELVAVREVAGERRVLGRWPLPVDPSALGARLHGRLACLPRHWVLAPDQVLRRRLQLPAAAGARLPAVMEFEIERQTPFSPGQAFHDVRRLGPGSDPSRLDVELVAVPRALWDSGDLAPWQGQLAGIDVAEGEGTLGVNLLPPALRRRQRDPLRPWPWVLLAMALACLVLAGAQWLDNRRDALAALRARVEAAAPGARAAARQVDDARARIAGVAFLDQKRSQRAAAIDIWRGLTRRLPDGTWLDSWSIQGDQLQVTGSSSDAAALVGALQDAPWWRDPALTSVVRDERHARMDRFTLVATLGPVAAVAQAQQGPAADAATQAPPAAADGEQADGS